MKGQRFVTIYDFEDPETFALVKEKGYGWMFWGSFGGRMKGPTHFWPCGTKVDAPEYCRYIIPAVFDWLETFGRPPMLFQQDNAPAHASKIIQSYMTYLEIQTFPWPLRSPDLSPIENVWHWMKNYMEITYDLQKLTLEKLKLAIQAAWEAVPEWFLEALARSMIRRLRQVIEREGREIDY
jgi:transposase